MRATIAKTRAGKLARSGGAAVVGSASIGVVPSRCGAVLGPGLRHQSARCGRREWHNPGERRAWRGLAGGAIVRPAPADDDAHDLGAAVRAGFVGARVDAPPLVVIPFLAVGVA